MGASATVMSGLHKYAWMQSIGQEDNFMILNRRKLDVLTLNDIKYTGKGNIVHRNVESENRNGNRRSGLNENILSKHVWRYC